MAVVAVIPARYKSSRFPGKVLAAQTGKYLVQHVYERVCSADLIDQVLIATDDSRVRDACADFGAPCAMTDPDHPSGTDRIAEAVADLPADIIVNVQGDEPEIEPAHLDRAVELLRSAPDIHIATLACPLDYPDDINNPNIVKAVVDLTGRALYFSRWPIPYCRDAAGVGPAPYRRHLGLYAYRKDVLLQISRLQPTPLEQAEKLEQLRALENGLTIAVADIDHPAEGIDTPQQYAAFVERYNEQLTTEK